MTLCTAIKAVTGVLLLTLLSQGCAWQGTNISRYLDSHSLADTLVKLESQPPDDRDRPIYLLNRGLVHHLMGSYQQSNQDLETAKIELEQVQAISVTQGFTSATLNETFNDYSATPSERVLLHVVMALNYLALNDRDSARVEVLQADVRMRQVGDEGAQLASARFIAGLIFEFNAEWSDAMISYRKAEQILTQRQLQVPVVLQARLLNSSRRLGLDREYRDYRDRFEYQPTALPENYGEVLVLYLNGKVPSLLQRRISIYAPSLEHNVTLSQPYYPSRSKGVAAVSTLALGTRDVGLELLEDVDHLAREALHAGQAKRLALSLARVVSKHQLVKKSREQDPLLGALVDLASILTEVADTRSWNLLPATVQVGMVQLPAGSYLTPVDDRSGASSSPLALDVKAGVTQLLIVNSYGNVAPLIYN